MCFQSSMMLRKIRCFPSCFEGNMFKLLLMVRCILPRIWPLVDGVILNSSRLAIIGSRRDNIFYASINVSPFCSYPFKRPRRHIRRAKAQFCYKHCPWNRWLRLSVSKNKLYISLSSFIRTLRLPYYNKICPSQKSPWRNVQCGQTTHLILSSLEGTAECTCFLMIISKIIESSFCTTGWTVLFLSNTAVGSWKHKDYQIPVRSTDYKLCQNFTF